MDGINVEIQSFFENMGEIMYISDPNTYDLVYLNRAGREALGVPSLDDIRGKKCYEVLHRVKSPCSMCTNALLRPGRFFEWTYFNSNLGRHYSLKDTLIQHGGRLLRAELAVNIDLEEKQREVLSKMRSNETVINQALELALNEDDPERSINVLLQYLGEHLDADRTYIFETLPDGTSSNTYEWCADRVSPQIQHLQYLSSDVLKPWYEEFDRHNNILIHDMEDYRGVCPTIYALLQPQGIQTLAVAPLFLNNRRIGFYGVDNPPYRNIENISTMYTILGRFIASLLRHRDNMKQIEACIRAGGNPSDAKGQG